MYDKLKRVIEENKHIVFFKVVYIAKKHILILRKQ